MADDQNASTDRRGACDYDVVGPDGVRIAIFDDAALAVSFARTQAESGGGPLSVGLPYGDRWTVRRGKYLSTLVTSIERSEYSHWCETHDHENWARQASPMIVGTPIPGLGGYSSVRPEPWPDPPQNLRAQPFRMRVRQALGLREDADADLVIARIDHLIKSNATEHEHGHRIRTALGLPYHAPIDEVVNMAGRWRQGNITLDFYYTPISQRLRLLLGLKDTDDQVATERAIEKIAQQIKEIRMAVGDASGNVAPELVRGHISRERAMAEQCRTQEATILAQRDVLTAVREAIGAPEQTSGDVSTFVRSVVAARDEAQAAVKAYGVALGRIDGETAYQHAQRIRMVDPEAITYSRERRDLATILGAPLDRLLEWAKALVHDRDASRRVLCDALAILRRPTSETGRVHVAGGSSDGPSNAR